MELTRSCDFDRVCCLVGENFCNEGMSSASLIRLGSNAIFPGSIWRGLVVRGDGDVGGLLVQGGEVEQFGW